ncbi:MAG: carboxylating nicotinate-nucleotide diphosphorylase [Nitrososphaerales archaeon]
MNPLIKDRLMDYLKEDVGFGDLTSNLILEDLEAKAIIIVKEDCIIAGLEEAKSLLELLGCKLKPFFKDGEYVKANSIVAEVRGKAKILLMVERTLLNLLMRMSGVATVTRRAVDLVKDINAKVKVACTRKTLPGFRIFDKRAVEIGGGDTHRLRLDDCILIKDNHLKLLSLELAIKKAKEKVSFTKKIEVEVSNKDEAVKAAKLGADIIMVDNFTPEGIKEVVDELKKLNLRDKVILEASGKINFENIKDYALSGVDVISLGFITHSARAIDFSMELS